MSGRERNKRQDGVKQRDTGESCVHVGGRGGDLFRLSDALLGANDGAR